MRIHFHLIAVCLGVIALAWGCDGPINTTKDSAEKTGEGGKAGKEPGIDGNPGEDGPDAPGGDDLYEACSDDAQILCREIRAGVYLEFGVGRQSPGCKFPTFDDVVENALCEGENVKKFLADFEGKDGQDVAVQGTFADWTMEPVPLCGKTEPFTGEPVIEDEYLAPMASWGVSNGDLKLAAVADNTAFLSKIQKDAQLTIRGKFKYKPIGKACSNGAVLYKSGFMELIPEDS